MTKQNMNLSASKHDFESESNPATKASTPETPESPATTTTSVTPEPSTIFFFCGVGAHDETTDVAVLQKAPLWPEVDSAMRDLHACGAKEYLDLNLASTQGEASATITTMINMLNASLWQAWGQSPDFVVGHSIGELAAAHAAGMYSVLETLTCAQTLGRIAASTPGGMLHTIVDKPEAFPQSGLHVSGVSYSGADGTRVALCGDQEAIQSWLDKDENAASISSSHPWHHPSYATTAREAYPTTSGPVTKDCVFVSATAGGHVFLSGECLDEAHWTKWLASPTDLSGAFGALADKQGDADCVVIECGAHPVSRGAVRSTLKPLAHVASLHRDVSAVAQLRKSRATLAAAGPSYAKSFGVCFGAAFPELTSSCPTTPFVDLGVDSAKMVLLAKRMQSCLFPGLRVPDLYHFSSPAALLKGWDSAGDRNSASGGRNGHGQVAAMILGVGLRLPGGLRRDKDVWVALQAEVQAIDDITGEGRLSFDHKAEGSQHGICNAELDIIDPQQVLALTVVASMLDSLEATQRQRVLSSEARTGVYLGVWQTPPLPEKASAYAVLGHAGAALAARVANTHNWQGPAVTINTACSSSLVAVDQALADLRVGRIDYAVVGGVNLLGDSQLISRHLRQAKFLSPTSRCHTFSSKADGYVRSEGGVCFLLARDDTVTPCRALVLGSAINQNSRRKPITSVDPKAQADLVISACRDAQVYPADISAIELHGTGTKIGDPVEVTALANTVGALNEPSAPPCYMTAAKMHFGHLESAAGALGLLKAVLMVEHCLVPRYSVPHPNDMVTSAMQDSRLRLVTNEPGSLSSGAVVGVSSFGFTGSNAHVLVRGVKSERAMMVQNDDACCPTQHEESKCPTEKCDDEPVESGSTATNESASLQHEQGPEAANLAPGPKDASARQDMLRVALHNLGIEVPSDATLTTSVLELGLDSLAAAELASGLNIDMDAIFDNPSLENVASLIKINAGALDTTTSQSLLFAALRDVDVEIPANVDLTTSVLDLGLDSLAAAELASRLHIDMDAIFDSPSLENLVLLVSRAGNVPMVKKTTVPVQLVTEHRNDQECPSPTLASKSEFPASSVNVPPSSTAPNESFWIRTTHVGSLPRKAGLGIGEIVRLQREAGFDVINDGEWSRADYVADSLTRVHGFANRQLADVLMPMASDMRDVPMHSRRFTGLNGLITLNEKKPAMSRMAFVNEPVYKSDGRQRCQDTMRPFLNAVDAENHPRSSCFWTAPSPGTVALFCRDDHFGDYETYVMALASALREEYEAIASSGLLLQVDAPCLAMGRHTRFSHLSEEEFVEKILKVNIRAINMAVANVPAEQIRLHVCWGNYPGPHHKDIDVSVIWEYLVQLNVKFLLVEMANPCHAGDIEAVRNVAHLLGDKIIVPGLVDTINPRVEHPRLIAKRILELASIVGPARVIAGTDCGFASTAKSMANTADISWMKVRSLVEGARMASALLYDYNSPVSTPYTASTATARVVLVYGKNGFGAAQDLAQRLYDSSVVAHTLLVDTEDPDILQVVRHRIDWSVVCVGLGKAAHGAVQEICDFVNDNATSCPQRRPALSMLLEDEACVGTGNIATSCSNVCQRIQQMGSYDKRKLGAVGAPGLNDCGSDVDVVVVGAGLLGLYAGTKLANEGYNVLVLERRNVAGGIWSLYANSTSQVNTSEGAYNVKDLLGDSTANKDHSSTKEIVSDLHTLAQGLGGKLRLGVTVNNVSSEGSGYRVHAMTSGEYRSIKTKGVLMCINDRVGVPRPFKPKFIAPNAVPVVQGIADAAATANLRWQGKRVVIVGMGAFAVENARTALESGATEVVVVARRVGTVCPKIIDYSNFTTEWNENFGHDMRGNAKNMARWRKLYELSGAGVPPGWPKQIKPKGHTISVSDIWFVAHKLGKLRVEVGSVDRLEPGAVVLDSGTRIPTDVVIPCIGFVRNASLCERLTGHSTVCTTNYLAKNMMYLADAEIDDDAFNSFFGSSVLEYGKFFLNVFIEGLRRGDQLGPVLWGKESTKVPVSKRAWSQYIASAAMLIERDDKIRKLARHQVDTRTARFMRTLPPPAYESSNRQDWEDLHTLLNEGQPVPKSEQLPYFTDL